MLTYNHTLMVTCDEVKNKRKCWKESIVSLDDGERLMDAKRLLKSIGWDLYAENYNICPYCSKGLEQKK